MSTFQDILQIPVGCSTRRTHNASGSVIKLAVIDRRGRSSKPSSSISTPWNKERQATRALLNRQGILSDLADASPMYAQQALSRSWRRWVARKTRRPRRTIVSLRNACSVSDDEIQPSDPGCAPPYYIDDPPWNDTIGVYSGPVVMDSSPPLPIPKTPPSLYQNLLYLLSYHPSSPLPLRDLLAYHTSFPSDLHLRSTRSYNLLIGLAIRHADYRSAEGLLSAMRAEKVHSNLETQKLSIRWMIRTGGWRAAWKEAMVAFKRSGGTSWSNMPLPIWLEFFGSMKRGAFRKRTRLKKWLWDGKGDVSRGVTFEVLTGEKIGVEARRYEMVMSHLPSLTRGELERMPPRTMRLAVQMMLRTGQKDLALEATKWYLKGLPSKVDDKLARASVELIHLHIIFTTTKRGLSGFHKTRKTINSLLGLHRQLRPNSTTLLLLLRGLGSSKRCGTIGRNFVSDFKRHWGAKMEDGRVMRRVARLALKEGRRDIVEEMIKKEEMRRWCKGMYEIIGDKRGKEGKLLRERYSKVYGKKGQEEIRWKIIKIN